MRSTTIRTAKPARARGLRIVFRLEPAIRLAAVVAVKLVGREKAVRVERLDAAELDHPALDQAVEMPGRMRLARALHVPEAEVDVPVALHRIEREAPRVRLRADRADPLRPERDLAGVKRDGPGCAGSAQLRSSSTRTNRCPSARCNRGC